eukprot:2490327-Rhodomonas_salina.2
MLALAAANSWITNSTDVTSAFINEPIDTSMYVRQPEGLEEPDSKSNPALRSRECDTCKRTDGSKVQGGGILSGPSPVAGNAAPVQESGRDNNVLRSVDPTRNRVQRQRAGAVHEQSVTEADQGSQASKKLYAYCDASDADNSFERCSTGGYVCYFNGSPVSWSTGLQLLTTLSMCESEYMQAALTAKEVLYLRELLHYAGHTQTTVTHVFEDNEAAMKLSENPINSCMHVALVPISSEHNVADIFTKPLGSQLFEWHSNALGVSSVNRGYQGLLAFMHQPGWSARERGTPVWQATTWEHDRPSWLASRCKRFLHASDKVVSLELRVRRQELLVMGLNVGRVEGYKCIGRCSLELSQVCRRSANTGLWSPNGHKLSDSC